ncbi:MAG TPA: hypothetical protein VFU47_04400 [Armatimonadota bacterium]|nr:hypothetical protein [Armatimonadota bacterium]
MTEESTEAAEAVAEEPETHPAHPVAEDPEAHMGEEVPDPWDTDEPDWPAETVEVDA